MVNLELSFLAWLAIVVAIGFLVGRWEMMWALVSAPFAFIIVIAWCTVGGSRE